MKKGVSLLEVLLSLTILSTGFLFILGIFPSSFTGIQHAKHTYAATALAEQQLERMKGLGVDGIRNLNPAAYDAGGAIVPSTQVSLVSQVNGVPQRTVFTYSVTAPPIPGIVHPGTSTEGTAIVVNVTWFDKAVGTLSPQNYLPGGRFLRSLALETWVVR